MVGRNFSNKKGFDQIVILRLIVGLKSFSNNATLRMAAPHYLSNVQARGSSV